MMEPERVEEDWIRMQGRGELYMLSPEGEDFIDSGKFGRLSEAQIRALLRARNPTTLEGLVLAARKHKDFSGGISYKHPLSVLDDVYDLIDDGLLVRKS